MRPVKQGDLDALCGVYALINALEPAGMKGPRSAIHKQLFKRLTLSLPRGSLARAMHQGLEGDDLVVAGRRAFKWMAKEHALSFSLTRPWAHRAFDSPTAFIAALEAMMQRGGVGVILNVHLPGLSHWSVASKVSGGRLLFRDSATVRHMEISRLSLTHGRYRVTPYETMMVSQKGNGAPLEPVRLSGRPDLRKQVGRIGLDRRHDSHELDDVDPPSAGFIFRDVGLVDAQPAPQLFLSQPGILSGCG